MGLTNHEPNPELWVDLGLFGSRKADLNLLSQLGVRQLRVKRGHEDFKANINGTPILGSTMAPGDKKRPTSPHFRYKFYFVFMVNLSTYSGKKQHGCSSVYNWHGRQLLPSQCIHLNAIASWYIEHLTPLSVNITREKGGLNNYKIATGKAYFAWAYTLVIVAST